MVSIEHADVWQELREIRHRLEVLEDAILSPDDRAALDEAREEFRKGKIVSHEEAARKLL